MARMKRVKSTRLRRSGIRKIFRNFSSMCGYPLQGFSSLHDPCHSILPANGPRCRPTLVVDAPSFDCETRNTPQLSSCRCRRTAKNQGSAASLFDLFHRGLGKLVGVNGDRRGQVARTENLDQGLLARGQAKLLVILQGDLGDSFESRDPVQVHDRILGAEDVGEAALGQTAMQRHLAALETAHQAEARARTLALVAAGRSLAHAGSHTATDTLAPRICLLGRA